MELNTLKRFRLIVPGILIFIVFVISINNSFEELKVFYKALIDFSIQDIVYVAIFMILGVLYYAFKIRYKLWDPFLNKVQINIKDSLLKPFPDEFDEEEKNSLFENRTLINLFYEFVDNNESLKEKAKLVRFNGLIWTICIDSTIILFAGSLILFCKYFFTDVNFDLVVALILLFLSMISFGLIFLITKIHIKLSNEQLEVITDLHRDKLHNRMRQLL